MHLVKTKNLLLTANELKKPLSVLPGGVKMTCSAMVLSLGLWISLQCGSQLNAADAFKIPVSLQSYVGAFTGWSDEPHKADVKLAVSFSSDSVGRMARLESNLVDSHINVPKGSPAHGQKIESGPHEEMAWAQNRDAFLAMRSALYLTQSACSRDNSDSASCGQLLASLPLEGTDLGRRCLDHVETGIPCPHGAKYRTVNGSCNHVGAKQRAWGRANTAYRRLLPADYEDGIHSVRNRLPSPRTISTKIIGNSSVPDNLHSLVMPQWSQFVAHDMSHTAASRMLNIANEIMCCDSNGNNLKPRHLHPVCLPVGIAENDPHYSDMFKTCMNYVRSNLAMRPDCSLGPAEQMNHVTHYLDGSAIYGSLPEKTNSVRLFFKGHLKHVIKDGARMFLPLSEDAKQHCQVPSDLHSCFKSGDTRVNMHPHLTIVHTLWLREHNRIADKLAELNPHWNDDRLFQEARRIVIAQIQHITYKHWLPLLIGATYTKKMGLEPTESGFSNKYDDNVDPSVTNSFSTAAMRFSHSQIDGELKLFDENRKLTEYLQLSEHYNKPRAIESEGRLDSLIRGLTTQGSQKVDTHLSKHVTSKLYQNDNPFGYDIISLDIQRSRDHGLPGYNFFRERCGFPRVSSFSGFSDLISKQAIDKLSTVYNHPDDVDLLIGGYAETSQSDGILGPTFRCIVGEQMARTRKGDSFFYDLGGRPSSFNEEQLNQIRNSSLARIFCDNSDGIVRMQPDVFQKPSNRNSLVFCTNTQAIPELDLRPWQEL